MLKYPSEVDIDVIHILQGYQTLKSFANSHMASRWYSQGQARCWKYKTRRPLAWLFLSLFLRAVAPSSGVYWYYVPIHGPLRNKAFCQKGRRQALTAARPLLRQEYLFKKKEREKIFYSQNILAARRRQYITSQLSGSKNSCRKQ